MVNTIKNRCKTFCQLLFIGKQDVFLSRPNKTLVSTEGLKQANYSKDEFLTYCCMKECKKSANPLKSIK